MVFYISFERHSTLALEST